MTSQDHTMRDIRDIISKLEVVLFETALNPQNPKADYEAKKAALAHLEKSNKDNDPSIAKAIQQRRLDLEKEAQAKGVKDESVEENDQQRVHGGAYDRGDADAYYGRRADPHKYVDKPDGSGRVRVKLTDPEEVKAYMAGYNSGDSGTKDWG
jgi:hypothetical protein